MSATVPPPQPVTWVTWPMAFRALIATVGLVWAVQGAWIEAIVAAVAFALTFVPLARFAPGAGPAVEAGQAAILAAHVCIGMACGGYEWTLPYDKLVHFAVSAAIALYLGAALASHLAATGRATSLAETRVLVVAGTLAVGAGWEIFEYALDGTGLFDVPLQLGLHDTMCDLLADGTGGAVAALFGTSSQSKTSRLFRED